MKTDETTRPVRKHTPEEIEAIRARKRARQEAGESGVEEVKRKKRTPEEIEALRKKKRARELAEAEAAAAEEAAKRKKRSRSVEEDEEVIEVRRKKRTPEEIEAIRQRRRERELAEAEAIAAEEAAKRKKRARSLEEEEELPEEAPVSEEDDDEEIKSFGRRGASRKEEDYEEDLGEPEDEDDDADDDDDDDFEEDELRKTKRTKKKERSYAWLLILLLVLLLAAVGAFAYLLSGTRAITLGKESISMLLGDNLAVEPVFTPSFARNKTYTLYSENPYIVSVNSDGSLTALAEGVTTISIVQDGVLYGTCPVTVGPVRVSGLSIENAPESMIVGESFTPEVKFVPENATHPEIELSISDESLAKLEGDTVTALAPGLLTVTATNSHSGLTKEAEIAILPIDPVSISLEMPETLTYGTDAEVEAIFDPEDVTDDEVTLTSSDPEIVWIDGMVLVPKGVGSATITATHSTGLTVSKDVTVYPKVTVSGATDNTIAQKKRLNLTVTLEPEGETGNIEWSSSNEAVVTVTKKGQIKGVGGGTAVITAKLASGAVGTVEITVPAIAQKCRSHVIVKGSASRNDVIEFMGMSEKNTVVKLECVDDPAKSCMLLVAKTGEMTTKVTTSKDGKKKSTTVSIKSWRVKIPAATYNVKIGFGDTWYGDTLLFGEDGEYYDLHMTYTSEKEGSFGISAISRAKNKEAITLEQFIG